jgi:hypothetical protein
MWRANGQGILIRFTAFNDLGADLGESRFEYCRLPTYYA